MNRALSLVVSSSRGKGVAIGRAGYNSNLLMQEHLLDKCYQFFLSFS